MMFENILVLTMNLTIDWLQVRMKEYSSWDGFTIIVIGVLVLSASLLMNRYAAWTHWKKSWHPFSTVKATASKDGNK
jgi:hypothetical protein